MQSVRVFFIVTLTTLSSWAATTAQAQNAIKLFGATPVTQSAPCEGPFGCDIVRDRMVFDEAWLALSCKGQPRAILSSTADGRAGLVVDNVLEVNGENVCGGSCFNGPVFEVVGTPALDAYQTVPPIDISRLLRPGARIDRKLQSRRCRRHLRQLRRVARDKLQRHSESGHLP